MKTIACLVNTFLRPSEGYIYEQIRNIKAFRVEVLTRRHTNREAFPFENVNSIAKARTLRSAAEMLAYTLFRMQKRFERIILEKNISLIHAHFGVEGVYALPLKRKTKKPLIVTFHGYDITRLPKFVLYPPAWFNYWLDADALKKEGDLFLAVSGFIARKMAEKGFPGDRIRTHYLGIDTKVAQQGEKSGKIVLTAGRLVEVKGTEFLIKAMQVVLRKHPSAQLWICGDGPLRHSLERLAERLGVARNVKFMGWKSKQEFFDLLSKTRVFSLPSVTALDGACEALGMVNLEAMVHGVPVIGTLHGGIPEVVRDGETGFLVPEKNDTMLAEKISILFSDASLAEHMGRRGREVARDMFDIRRQIAKLEAIYTELA